MQASQPTLQNIDYLELFRILLYTPSKGREATQTMVWWGLKGSPPIAWTKIRLPKNRISALPTGFIQQQPLDLLRIWRAVVSAHNR